MTRSLSPLTQKPKGESTTTLVGANLERATSPNQMPTGSAKTHVNGTTLPADLKSQECVIVPEESPLPTGALEPFSYMS